RIAPPPIATRLESRCRPGDRRAREAAAVMRKRKSRYARREVLTDQQEMDLFLCSGIDGFRSDEERRTAWFRSRDQILSEDENFPYGGEDHFAPDALIRFELGGYGVGETRPSHAHARLLRDGKLPLKTQRQK